jgi:hypothetical protein
LLPVRRLVRIYSTVLRSQNTVLTANRANFDYFRGGWETTITVQHTRRPRPGLDVLFSVTLLLNLLFILSCGYIFYIKTCMYMYAYSILEFLKHSHGL